MSNILRVGLMVDGSCPLAFEQAARASLVERGFLPEG